MLEIHARLSRLLRWRFEGAKDEQILARIEGEDPAWHADLRHGALPEAPLVDLMREAAFDTPLIEEVVADLMVAEVLDEVHDDAHDGQEEETEDASEWDPATRDWIARIVSACSALGHAGPAAAEAGPLLFDTLERATYALPRRWFQYVDENPYLAVTGAAARALGRIGVWPPQIFEDVKERRRNSRWHEAFREMVRAGSERVPRAWIPLLVEMADVGSLRGIPLDRWPRDAVIRALGLDLLDHIEPRVVIEEKDIGTIRGLIHAGGKTVVAVRNLGALGARARVALPILEEELRRHATTRNLIDRAWTVAAVEALEGMGGPTVRDRVRDPDAGVRLGAILSLQRRRVDLPLVRTALRDRDAHVRQTAVEALASYPGEDPMDAARDVLDHADHNVRRIALDLLAKRDAPGVEELLRRATADGDGSVRWTAKWWLRERGGPA